MGSWKLFNRKFKMEYSIPTPAMPNAIVLDEFKTRKTKIEIRVREGDRLRYLKLVVDGDHEFMVYWNAGDLDVSVMLSHPMSYTPEQERMWDALNKIVASVV